MDRAVDNATVLVVEDDPDVSNTIRRVLESGGYDVETARDGASGLRKALGQPTPSLLLLDLMLPDLHGLDVFRRIRAAGHDLPVMFVTGFADDQAHLVGIELDVVDIVHKPFDGSSLLARVGAALRRPRPADALTAAGIRLDLAAQTARRGGREFRLTPTEYAVLFHLMQRPNQVVSKDALLAAVWRGKVPSDSTRYLPVISRLRDKLHAPGERHVLLTIPGAGYCLTDPAAPLADAPLPSDERAPPPIW
jgi:DNA-binding response OmpR family regulator